MNDKYLLSASLKRTTPAPNNTAIAPKAVRIITAARENENMLTVIGLRKNSIQQLISGRKSQKINPKYEFDILREKASAGFPQLEQKLYSN